MLLCAIYLSFISLGLPDAILGSAWPSMYEGLNVPLEWASIISTLIAVSTVICSLYSYKLTQKFGVGRVTAFSVLLTAFALLGFSVGNSFIWLCLMAIPYGLGAGTVDAALNNFVAVNFASRHMSWLHCMWGVGASIGPYIMANALRTNHAWQAGYRQIAFLQLALSLILFLSLPIWKNKKLKSEIDKKEPQNIRLRDIINIKGVKSVMLSFFCYCGIETSAGLWASSFLVNAKGFEKEAAAGFAALFFVGISIGRALSGFMTIKFNDKQMVRLGLALIGAGIALLLLPLASVFSLIGFGLIGLGCAPIYPCLIHATPKRFSKENSQALIGVQMASAYFGSLSVPPVFGFLAAFFGMGIIPFLFLSFLVIMTLSHERLIKITEAKV